MYVCVFRWMYVGIYPNISINIEDTVMEKASKYIYFQTRNFSWMIWIDRVPYIRYGNLLTHGKLARQTVDAVSGIVSIVLLNLTKQKRTKQDYCHIDVVCEFNSTQWKGHTTYVWGKYLYYKMNTATLSIVLNQDHWHCLYSLPYFY